MTHFERISWLVLALSAESCALPEYTKDLQSSPDAAGSNSGGSNPGGSANRGGASSGGTNGGRSGGSNHAGTATLLVSGGAITVAGSASVADGGTTSQPGTDQGGTDQGGTSDTGGVPVGAAGRGGNAIGGNFTGGSTTGGNTTTHYGGGPIQGGAAGSGGMVNFGGMSSNGGSSTFAGTPSTGGQTSMAGTAGVSGLSSGGVTSTGGTTGTGGSAIVCATGYDTCHGKACDTQISASTDDCGACGNPCVGKQANWRCAYSCIVTTCTSGWGNCNTVDSDGCEVEFAKPNPSHCGACNNACQQTICGNNDGLDALAHCYSTKTIGRDSEYPGGALQGFRRGYLFGMRHPLGDGYTKPDLISMGVVEMNADSKYVLALYASDANNRPAERIWMSDLQTSQLPNGATSHVNEVQLPGPIRLTAQATYWHMVLVYDPNRPTANIPALEVSTAGSGSPAVVYEYADVTAMPVTLLNNPGFTDVSATRQMTATFIRVAHP